MKNKPKRILVIDNFDSFVYVLVQYLGELGAEVIVKRNNDITPEEAADLKPDGVLISPGPGRPEGAGVSMDMVRHFHNKLPLFGVCLGHQCIGQFFGAEVVQGKGVVHGKTSAVSHEGDFLFEGMPNPFDATRYHSLLVESIPSELEVTAKSEDGTVMGLRHKDGFTHGVQFHPESVLTQDGMRILRNFLQVL